MVPTQQRDMRHAMHDVQPAYCFSWKAIRLHAYIYAIMQDVSIWLKIHFHELLELVVSATKKSRYDFYRKIIRAIILYMKKGKKH